MNHPLLRIVMLCTAAASIALSSGCATVTTGTTQSVSVVTKKDVEDARCKLTDSKARTWYVQSTPGTVQVRKGDGPMTVECTKDGFQTALLVVREVFAGATLGNIILGGGIGLIVDAASGAAQRYPDQIVVWMRPEKWASDAQKANWEAEKRAFEAEVAAKREAEKKSLESEPEADES